MRNLVIRPPSYLNLIVALVCCLVASSCTPASDDDAPATTLTTTPTTNTSTTTTPSEETSVWSVSFYVDIGDGLQLVGNGDTVVGDGEALTDLIIGGDSPFARVIQVDGQTGVGIAPEGGETTWIDVTDPMPFPADVTLIGPPPEVADDPVRVEELDGRTLQVFAQPVAGIASREGLAARVIEAWVDDNSVIHRIVEQISTKDSQGQVAHFYLVADRSVDAPPDPPSLGSTLPGPAALRRSAISGEVGNVDELIVGNAISVGLMADSSRIGRSVATNRLAAASNVVPLIPECELVWRPEPPSLDLECSGLEFPDVDLELPPLPDLPPLAEAPDPSAVQLSLGACVMALLGAMSALGGGGLATLFGATFLGGFAIGVILGAVLIALCLNAEQQVHALVHGDPHLDSFDGYRYDLQAIGEFVFVDSPGLEVQTRFGAGLSGGKGLVTYVHAVAVRSGDHVIESYHADSDPTDAGTSVLLDGERVSLDLNGVTLSDGTFVAQRSSQARVETVLVVNPSGSYVIIEILSFAQNVTVGLSNSDVTTVTGGFGGIPDGDATNDFILRDGTTLDLVSARTIEGLYGTFASAWRVRPEERLFTMGEAADFLTEEFTSLPERAASISDFDPAAIAEARGICRDAGVAPGEGLEDCAYDVVATEDVRWAEQAGASVTVLVLAGGGPPVISESVEEVASDHPLLIAADRCALEEVVALLNEGTNPNLRRADDGWTALLFAAQRECNEVVTALLDAGSDPNAATVEEGVTPLYLAAQNGRNATVTALLAADADPKSALPSGDTPLLVASFHGHAEIVNGLIAAGAPVDISRDGDGFTPLLAATQEGWIDIAEVLVKAGADPNRTDAEGRSALIVAAADNSPALTQTLVDAGADPNRARLRDGVVPLHFAAQDGHVEVLAILVGAAADPDTADLDGVTPLHLAAGRGQADAVEALIAAGADVTLQDETGLTALHLAASSDNADIARALLSAGADPDAADTEGRTPRDLAGPGVTAVFEGV